MKKQSLSSVFAALALTAAATASAQVRIGVGVNPIVFGGYPPPVVYQPAPYYSPPPVSTLAADPGAIVTASAKETTGIADTRETTRITVGSTES